MEVADGLQRRVLREFGVAAELVSWAAGEGRRSARAGGEVWQLQAAIPYRLPPIRPHATPTPSSHQEEQGLRHLRAAPHVHPQLKPLAIYHR